MDDVNKMILVQEPKAFDKKGKAPAKKMAAKAPSKKVVTKKK
jgi:hypothetical protein